MVFTLNLLLRSRDNDTKEIKEMTVWEAHFGRKPNLNHYLLGPWGCLAYIVLTKEPGQEGNGQELGSEGTGGNLCRLRDES